MVWMFLSTFAFSAMVGFVREASATFNTFEITFWRALFGLAFMIPWLVRVRLRGLRTTRAKMHLTRNVLHFIGIVTWVYVVAWINLSVGIALQFTVPLFTIAMAALILKERVDAARWTATMIGFAGVLVIIRPDTGTIDVLAVITLISAAFYAASNIATMAIGRDDSSEKVVFYMHLMHLPMALIGTFAFGLAFMIPWLVRVRLRGLRCEDASDPQRPPLHWHRDVGLRGRVDQSQRRNRASAPSRCSRSRWLH